MARLGIRLFGSFEIRLDGEPVTGFASDKVRALLAYLTVTAGRSHRRETLAGLLWPEYPERSARAALRNALANLRKAIGDRTASGDHDASPPFLEITRQAIQFNPESDYWLDVMAFSDLLTAEDPTSEGLEEAVALYQGPFLEGFSLADSTAFEQWLLMEREQRSRQVLEVLYRLVEIQEGSGAYEQALAHAWRQVELEPWREEGQQQVMRLLALSGRRSEALAQYERCRQLLQDELGVEPAAETSALYEAIRSGEVSHEMAVPVREGAPPSFRKPAPIYNLPPQPTPFIGRAGELAALQGLLADAAVRLVTIAGPGGIGKTRLALAVGALAAGDQDAAEPGKATLAFPHGVVFVPLATSSSARDIVLALAGALQLRLERGQAQLFDYLRHKQLLLILDNLEHLPDGGGLLAEILRTAPGAKMLATSRARLQLHGEQVFPIQGLAFPEQDPTPSVLASVDVDAYVETYPAIKLFVDSARRVHPAFAPCPDDLTILARICRLVEGMPLALELAASWADTLALYDILVEIRQSLDFLETEWRDIVRRQRSVRAVFDTSWGQLGKAEQALFPQLSVFRGGFTRAAAEEVAVGGKGTGISPRLLSRLVSKSFLRYDQTNDRYQMLELLRQYGAERLAQDPVHEAEVRDLHSRHFCRWLQEQEASMKSGKQQAALHEIEIEIENVQSACCWAASQGEAKRLSEAMGALGLFYDWSRSYQAGEMVLGNLAERLTEAGDPSSPMTDIAHQAMARILMWQSRFNGLLGNAERREKLVLDGLAHLNSPPLATHDTRLERAFLWLQLAYAQYGEDQEAARELFVQSRNLFQEVGDRCGLADALIGLGRVARNLHAYEEAEEAIAESLALRQATGDHIGSAEALNLLSIIVSWQAQFAKAERLVRQSLAITRDASGLLAWGITLILSGRFVEAKKPVAESLALHMDLGMRVMGFWAFLSLSYIQLHLGDYQAASVQAEEALRLARQVDSDRQAGIALGQLGAVALAERAYPLAHERCKESLATCQEVLVHPSPLDCLGLAARGLGQHGEAGRHFLAQLQWAVERRSFFPLPFTLSGIALLLADRGEAERAVEVYALASRHPYVAKSRWFEDVAGREIAAVAAALPPGAAAAAKARGQDVDLWQAGAELLEMLRVRFDPSEKT